MTTPTTAYVRLVMAGTIANTQSWSTGLSMSPPPTTLSQADLQAFLAAAEPLVTAWWGSGAGTPSRCNAADTRVTALRAYLYSGIDGTPAALQAERVLSSPLAGTGTTYAPTQTALVATLLTGLPGRSFKGRCYMPATALPLGSDHNVANTDLTTLAGVWKSLIDGLNSVAAPDLGRVVVHGSRGSFSVTQVRVDSEPDIQRRRADKLLATRQVTVTMA